MALSKILPASQEQVSYTGGRNLVINGSMQVAQRGTSSTSSGYYTVDRWSNTFSGASVTQTQESLSSGDPYDLGLRNFARLEVTTASSSGAGDFAQFYQRIEAQNMANSGWNYTSSSSYITVSFWARSSLAGTYWFWMKTEDGTSQSFSHSFSLSANTWTKITKTIPGNSNLQFDNDNGIGLDVFVVPHYGTTYTSASHTSDAWQTYSGSDVMGDYTQTWTDTLNATFDLTGVQLEVGDTATPFEHRSYGDELVRCQRYYQKIDYGAATGSSSYNYKYYEHIPFKTTMRAAPTLTSSAFGSDTGNAGVVVSTTTYNGFVLQAAGTEGAYIVGSVANTYNQLYGRAKFDAEL